MGPIHTGAPLSFHDETVVDTADGNAILQLCPVTLGKGQTINFGTAQIDGARCTGDTFVGLAPAGQPRPDPVAMLDKDPSGCPLLNYTVGDKKRAGNYNIVSGCRKDMGPCSGVVAWYVVTPPSLAEVIAAAKAEAAAMATARAAGAAASDQSAQQQPQ